MPAARLLQSWALAQCSAFLHSLGWYYSSDQTAPPILDCKHPEKLDHHLPPAVHVHHHANLSNLELPLPHLMAWTASNALLHPMEMPRKNLHFWFL
jgi:hypothetical protein